MKNKRIVIAIGLIAIIGIAVFVLSGTYDNKITGFGTDFNKQKFIVNLDEQPTDTVTMTFSARIFEVGPGSLVLDYFPAYIRLDNIPQTPNVVGEFYNGKWDIVDIQTTEFKTYSVELPADLNNDGLIDWKMGSNEVTMWTLSSYKSHVGKMEIEWIEFSVS